MSKFRLHELTETEIELIIDASDIANDDADFLRTASVFCMADKEGKMLKKTDEDGKLPIIYVTDTCINDKANSKAMFLRKAEAYCFFVSLANEEDKKIKTLNCLDLLVKDLTKTVLEIPDDIDDLFIMSTNTDHLYDSENGKVFLEKMKETFNSLNNISDYFPEFGNAINDACVDYEYDTNDEYEEDDDEYEDEEVEEDEEEEDEEDEEEEEEEEDDYDMNSDESEENEMIPLMRSDSGILFASFIPEPSTERESEDYDSLDEIE